VYNTIKVANLIAFYIHKKKLNLLFRIVYKKKDCVAFNFFLLMSLLDVKSELQALGLCFDVVVKRLGCAT
jgi:hypothetical protein